MLPAMSESTAQRIGTALRQMAEDLVAERRRSMLLAQENRKLHAELERLRGAELERLRRLEARRLRRAAASLEPLPPPNGRVQAQTGSM